MKPYPVYTLWDIEPVAAHGCQLTDNKGTTYLDLYGGHAVISIGHSHPTYVQALTTQLQRLGFYSNSVRNTLQEQLSEKLGQLAGYPDYSLFLCNSGAEANENALKLASFQTGRQRVAAFTGAFHGRTSGAVAVTDNPRINTPFNAPLPVDFLPFDNIPALEEAFAHQAYAAVIVEGIQGVSGIHEASTAFFQRLRALCSAHGTCLILDEVQSGCGRTGSFFAHQAHGIQADIITQAKGIGNGFPLGAVLIAPWFTPTMGQLGSTFGGNHLACTAALAVLQVIQDERLMDNALHIGNVLQKGLNELRQAHPSLITEIRGRGLMLGIQLNPQHPASATLRDKLLFEHHIFTGGAGKYVIRLLPPLCLTQDQATYFLTQFKSLLV